MKTPTLALATIVVVTLTGCSDGTNSYSTERNLSDFQVIQVTESIECVIYNSQWTDGENMFCFKDTPSLGQLPTIGTALSCDENGVCTEQ